MKMTKSPDPDRILDDTARCLFASGCRVDLYLWHIHTLLLLLRRADGCNYLGIVLVLVSYLSTCVYL